jgi:hypothetical protein
LKSYGVLKISAQVWACSLNHCEWRKICPKLPKFLKICPKMKL